MANFYYKSKNLKGEEETGFMEAEDASDLAKKIKQKGYFLVYSRRQDKSEGKSFLKKAANSFGGMLGVSLSEKLFFTRNLRVMIKTGVPLPRAFNILARQSKNKKFKKILTEISEKIIKGEPLSSGLEGFSSIFSNLYIETIKVGEETGNIEESLEILATQMEREHTIKSNVKTAMVYPAIVVFLALIIGVVMFVFAVPRLKEAFTEMEVELPATTKMVLSLSDFMSENWLAFFVLALIFIFCFIYIIRKGKGSRIFSKISLILPGISGIVKNINSAIMLRTLSSLLSAGVPIVRSLIISSGTLNNFYFKKSLREASEKVKKGRKLSVSLEPYEGIYAPMVLEMMKVGEETGETSEVLEKLADFYEKEVEAATEKLSSVIEPFLIALIGVFVGFFAISMLQPMFSIVNKI